MPLFMYVKTTNEGTFFRNIVLFHLSFCFSLIESGVLLVPVDLICNILLCFYPGYTEDLLSYNIRILCTKHRFEKKNEDTFEPELTRILVPINFASFKNTLKYVPSFKIFIHTNMKT